MTTIALFGTSADPPTVGHAAILEGLSQDFDQIAVWASDNPFKAHQVSLTHRQNMLALLIKDAVLPRQNVVLYPELSDPKALTTVKVARSRWPEAEFTFVIGSDLLPKLNQWYRIEAVLVQVQLLIIPRPSYPLQEQDLDQLRHKGAKIAIANFTGPDVSSTAYRDQRIAGLTPAIASYIHQKQLYSCVEAGEHRMEAAMLPGPTVT